MANKKISELQTRTPSLTDLILVGDPSNGFSYKCTVSALATIIETDISDGYVTLGTTQTISGAKTFSNNLTLTSVANASTDPDKFLVLNGSNVVNYRTGSEVLSDIGGQGTITLTTTGTSGAATFAANTLNIPQYQGVITLTTTGTSGAATLVGNTLNIPNYAPDLSGYVPTSRTITINGTTQDLTANRTYNVGTVTSVAASAGTGISISGSPITSSGTITITNTAPDQVVALTAGTGISISGTYPNFTITNSSPSLGGTVTSVALSAPTGFAVTGSPITSSGTLALAFDTGYSLPTTASQTNWDSAYNNMIVSAAVTGTTTKTLTLTQQDAGTITASWTDDNTDAVTSVFGRTGAVVATEGDYSLTQLSDVTITTPSTGQVLKYNGTIWVNDTDANTGTVTSVALSAPTGFSVSGSPITSSGTLALSFASGYSLPTTASQTNWDTAYTNRITSLTTTGSSGAATLISNTLNIPNYTLAGLGGISLTSLSASAPLSYNNTTGAFSISQSNTTTDGYLSSTDWNTFNGKIGGNGTSNYVPKFTATSTLGNSQIFDNGTNVGINTATPSEKLEVSGILRVSRTTSASVYLNVTAESGNIIFDARGSSDQIFHTQTLERLRIGLGGDITISTINNATIDTDKFLVSDSGVIKYRTGSEILSDIGGQGALTLTTTGTSGAATLVGNTLNIPQYSGGGGSVSGTTNYIAKFTSSTAVGDSQIFDDGTNVGISTATAGSKLQVNGNAAIGYSTSTAATSNGLAVAGRVGIGTNTPSGGLQVSLTDVYNYFSSNSQAATLTDVQGLAIGWNRSNGGGETILVYNKGAGSTGGLAFSNNDGGTFNERMRLTSAGSLGILTTTIGSTLQVNGNAAIGYSASTAAPSNGLVVSGNVGFNTTTIGSRLQINGNAAIGYSASTAAPTNGLMVAGNVGVNVTPSAWASGFRAIQIGARTALFNSDINITTLGNNIFYDGVSYKYITSAAGSSIDLGGNYMTFGTLASGTAGATATGVERARIHTDGIFYIGNGDAVASPNTGIISATGGSGTNIAGAEFRIRGGASTGSGVGGPITFYTSAAGSAGTSTNAATERMRITSGGNVGIGTTSPANQLTVAGAGGAAYVRVEATDATLTAKLQARTAVSAIELGAVSNSPVVFVTNDTERMRITSGGNVGIGTQTIGSTLQVNGNAAIGYSASTAAPTNGLTVAGNVIGATFQASNTGRVFFTSSALTNGVWAEFINTGGSTYFGKDNSVGTAFGTGTAYSSVIYESGANPMVFFTNALERIRITSSGEMQLKPAANTAALTTSGSYSLTGSNASSLLDLAGTWNTTGNPTAIKLNITNTASGASAYLMDLQVGGTTQFRVTKAGAIRTTAPTGGTANDWKLGTRVAATVVLDTTQYAEVEIGGTLYKLAMVN